MTTRKIVYTTFGKYARYDVVMKSYLLLDSDYVLMRNGEYKATYSSLRSAVAAADYKASR